MFSAKGSAHFNLVSAILFNLMLFSGCQQLLMGDPICLQLLLQTILSFFMIFPWLINTKVRFLCIWINTHLFMCINKFMHLHFHICLHMCKKIGKGSEGFSLKYWQLLPLGTRDGRGQWLRGNFILLYLVLYCLNSLQWACITFIIKEKEKKRKEIKFDIPPSDMKPSSFWRHKEKQLCLKGNLFYQNLYFFFL